MVVLILLSSCMPINNFISVEVKERLLSFPSGYYNHVVYIDGRIIGFAEKYNLPKEEQVSFAYEGDKNFTNFNPENDPKCIIYSYFQVVSMLPDGRLGLLKECHDDSASTGFLSTNRSIYAYDWHTGELERLVAGKLTQASNPKFYTWNPDMTLGIQETNSGWQGTIYWIAPEGMSPMDIQKDLHHGGLFTSHILLVFLLLTHLLLRLFLRRLQQPTNNGCGFIGRERNSGWN
jgi:hypothetical protein